LIASRLKENPKLSLSIQFKEKYPQRELYYFWAINALDVWTTNRGLKDPNIYEVNPIVGKDPHLDRLILFKLVWGNLIIHTYEKDDLLLPNTLITIAVINNFIVLEDNGLIF